MKRERIYWGLFLVLCAVFLIVSKLGFMADVNLFSLIFTIFFAAILIKSIAKMEFGGIFFSIAFICIIYAKELHITALTPWTVLMAALLASIGCSMLFHKRKVTMHCGHNDNFSTIREEENGNTLNFGAKFGSSLKYVNAEDFHKATIDCSFAGMKVYFDNAVIQNGSAEINLNLSFSGVELYIPRSWNIVNNANISLAGIDEKNKNEPTGNNTVYLTGDVSLSGVTIIYI